MSHLISDRQHMQLLARKKEALQKNQVTLEDLIKPDIVKPQESAAQAAAPPERPSPVKGPPGQGQLPAWKQKEMS